MLTELVDLAFGALTVMWILFIGLVIYTGWFDQSARVQLADPSDGALTSEILGSIEDELVA